MADCGRHLSLEGLFRAESHLDVEPSVDSVCSSDSVTSEPDKGSGSGFRIRKKRKQPTKLITVSEMNTVRRSLSAMENKYESDGKNKNWSVSAPKHKASTESG